MLCRSLTLFLVTVAAVTGSLLYLALPSQVSAACSVRLENGQIVYNDPTGGQCGGYITTTSPGVSGGTDIYLCSETGAGCTIQHVSGTPSTPTAQTEPFTLSASTICSGNKAYLDLDWTDAPSLGRTGDPYRILRDGSQISTTTATIYNNREVPESETHVYQVSIRMTAGTIYTNELTVITPQCSTPPPPPPPPVALPGAFTATGASTCSQGYARVQLNWTDSSNAQYYLINEYSPTGNQSTATGTGTSYFSSVISNAVNQTWTYSVYAINGSGQTVANNGNTIQVAVNCPAPPELGTFGFSVATACTGSTPIAIVTWTNAPNAQSYTFFQSHRNPDTNEQAGPLSSSESSYQFTMQGSPGELRYFYGSASDQPNGTGTITLSVPVAAIGQSIGMYFGSPVGSIGAPIPSCDSPPGSFTVNAQFECQPISAANITGRSLAQWLLPIAHAQGSSLQQPVISLSWTDAPRASQYIIIRISSGTEALRDSGASLTSNSFADSAVIVGQSYSYRIVAINSGGQTSAQSNTVQVNSCVTDPVNTPPDAVDDSVTTARDNSVVVDILANDGDSEGALDIGCTKIVTQPTNGTVSIDPTTGRATYTPNSGFTGTDSFVYEACDQEGLIDTATVTVTILPPPGLPFEPPTTTVSVVAACDGATPQNVLTWVNTSSPSYRIRRDGSELTTVTSTTYTDQSVVAGQTYRYQVDTVDPQGVGPGNEVTTTTLICNQTPDAVDDSTTNLSGEEVDIDILANDSDPDGTLNPACVTITGQPIHGTVSVNSTNGHVIYTSESGYTGTDSFIYEVCDDDGLKDTATVTVTITLQPPAAAVLSLTALCVGNAPQNVLTWTAASRATSYQVLRNNTLISTDSATSFTDTAVVAGTRYDYRVDAINSAGQTSSNIVSQTVISCEPNQPPSTPPPSTVLPESVSPTPAAPVTPTTTPVPAKLVSTGIPLFNFFARVWESLLRLIGIN